MREIASEEELIYHGGVLADGAAANIYRDSTRTDYWMQRLDEKLGVYIAETGLDPRRLPVRHMVNRTRHKAVSASLYHLTELAAGEQFLQAYSPTGLDLDAYTDGLPDVGELPYPYTGDLKRHVAIDSAVDLLAVQSTLAAVQRPEHPYYPVWEAYTEAQSDFAETDFLYRGHRRKGSPVDDFTRTTKNLSHDTILPLIMQPVLQYQRDEGLRGKALIGRLMQHSEELSWASTLSRRSRSVVFPSAGEVSDTTPACPFAPGRTVLFATDLTLHRFWNRPDICDGPRESSSFCPVSSNAELVSFDMPSSETTEAIYAVQSSSGAERHLSRPYGAGSAAEMHAIRTITLLGSTVFRDA